MASVSSTKKIANKGLIKTLEIKASCSYQTEDGRFIDKILDGIANCTIETSEKVGDFLQFAGKVVLTSVFVDNEKQLGSERVEANFTEKVQIGDVDATAIIPTITAVKQRRETSSFVDCTISVLVEIFGVMQETIAYVEAGTPNWVEKAKEVEAESLLCFNNSLFTLTEEVESSDHIDRIIANYSTLVVNKVVHNGNYVVVEGEINRDILYHSDGTLRKLQKRNDFAQEVALLNCTEETIVSAKLHLACESVSLDVSDDGAKSILTFNTNISASIWGFEKSKFNVLEDVYSTEKDLEVKHSTFTNISHLPVIIASESLSETIDMSDKKRIDEIISIGSNVLTLESTNVDGGNLGIAGVINQKVIAKNYDNDDIFSTELEIPFSIQLRTSIEDINANFAPVVVARCVNARNKAGKELNLTYEIGVMSDIAQSNIESYISECTETADKTHSNHSIVIYMPEKNEKVFDIAKKLNVTPEVMLAQNPGISDNEPIDKIVLFKCMK